eukprot:1308128-Amphidinium_carterae.1
MPRHQEVVPQLPQLVYAITSTSHITFAQINHQTGLFEVLCSKTKKAIDNSTSLALFASHFSGSRGGIRESLLLEANS